MFENISNNSTKLAHEKVITVCFQSDEAIIKAGRVLAYTIISLLSLCGNSLVIGVLWQDRKMRKPVIYLIANMAVADLAITIVYMPRMISAVIRSYDWLVGGTMGLVLCKTVPTIHLVSVKVTILTLVFLSVERFSAVSPFAGNKLTVHRVKVILIAVWLVSFMVHTPNVIALKLAPGQGGALICRAYLNKLFGSSKGRKIYDNVLAAIFYAAPLFLIVVLYMLAAIKLRNRRIARSNASTNGHEASKDKVNANVFKMLLAVTLAFISCWLSYFVMRKAIIGVSISCNVQFVRYFLAHTNSAVTPCLYITFSQKYRSSFKSIMNKFRCRVPSRVRSGTTLSLLSQSATSFSSLGIFPRGINLVSLRVNNNENGTTV
ncbi:orexin receptor type 2-like [Stylophora pistillata]|uniref:orexin receptor type 2-like n=1 Tax=Stylophora pistillata TaxID=50429 RepID=UPI000C052A8A|nr:orexin receptor type 2-like [Stylophora pistillata]